MGSVLGEQHQAIYRGLPRHTVYINEPPPVGDERHIYRGEYRYCVGTGSQVYCQTFYLIPDTKEDSLKEIDAVVTLGRYLERKYAHQRVQITDVLLPPCLGYCGKRLGYRYVLWLFPHAGYRRARRVGKQRHKDPLR